LTKQQNIGYRMKASPITLTERNYDRRNTNYQTDLSVINRQARDAVFVVDNQTKHHS